MLGHYNCRDYYVSPPDTEQIHLTSNTNTSNTKHPQHHHAPLHRHESYAELEYRSRSPASFKPKFPLLRLPLELRQEIFSYLLPRTRELLANPLANHARNFSAVKKRGARGMAIPAPTTSLVSQSKSVSNVVWQRGNTALFAVCKQLHRECAEEVYGKSTFLIFVTFESIRFRFRWLLSSSLAPSTNIDFLDKIAERYRRMIKRVVVHLDYVDSYLGMIKYNVGGKGLTHKLRGQVLKLVVGLRGSAQFLPTAAMEDGSNEEHGNESAVRHFAKVAINVSSSNSVLESIKSDKVRQREGNGKMVEDLETVLEPFGQLCGVREATVNGAVSDMIARDIERRMQSTEPMDCGMTYDVDDDGGLLAPPTVQTCVYGNDI